MIDGVLVTKIPLRILRALTRYITAFYNLGFGSALKIFLHSTLSRKEVELSMMTKKFGRIFWNTKSDWVISHLYTPQVELYSPTENMNLKTIIDLGANIGTESIRFGKLYPEARIIAVEAVKRNFEQLQKNISSFQKIEVSHTAIWSEKCKLKLISATDDSQGWHLEAVDANQDYDMLGQTFHDLMQSFKVSSIDVLKVDIEGAEMELFGNNCDQWIHNVKCLIIECPDGDSPLATSKIFKIFNDVGYTFNTYINGENLILVRSDLDWLPRPIELY